MQRSSRFQFDAASGPEGHAASPLPPAQCGPAWLAMPDRHSANRGVTQRLRLPFVVSSCRPSAACRAAARSHVHGQPVVCLLPLLPHQAVKQHLVLEEQSYLDGKQTSKRACTSQTHLTGSDGCLPPEQPTLSPPALRSDTFCKRDSLPATQPTVEAHAAMRKVALNQRCSAS